jgi:hypothetical protein
VSVTGSLGIAGAALLLVAGGLHLLHPHRFAASLSANRIMGARWSRGAAVAWAVIEVILGAAALVGLPGPGVFLAVGALYSLMAFVVGRSLRAGATAPCGCLTGDHPMGSATLGRALVFAAGAIGASTTTIQTADLAAGMVLALIATVVVPALDTPALVVGGTA